MFFPCQTFAMMLLPTTPQKQQESYPAFGLHSPPRRMKALHLAHENQKMPLTKVFAGIQEEGERSNRKAFMNELIQWVQENEESHETNKDSPQQSLERGAAVPPQPGFVGPLSIDTSSHGQGDGLFVTQDVSQNDYLMVIPETKCMSLEYAWEDDELGDVFCFLTDEGGPGARTAALAGFMAKEWLQIQYYGSSIGGSSTPKWDPYLRVLPWKESDRGQEHMLWWTHEKVEELLGDSFAYDEVLNTLNEVDVAVENLQTILLHDPDLHKAWDPDNLITNETEMDHTIRSAFVSILSRAFEDVSVDCSKLVPLLDMVQHDGSVGGANVHHETIPSSGNVIVKAMRDMEAGEELLINYSSKLKPHQFFTVFGFIPGETSNMEDLLKNKSPLFFSPGTT